jgi:uncharacterized protein (TIGR02145 family)
MTGFVFGILFVFISFFFFRTAISVSNYISSHLSQKSLSTLKNSKPTQAPTAPNDRVKWTIKVPASAILAGKHLVEIPKGAEEVKITPLSKESSILTNTKPENLTISDRRKLSKISKEISKSEASIKLAESLKQQEAIKIKNDPALRKPQGFLSRIWSSFTNNIGKMTAATEEALAPIQDALAITPEPEVITVDIAPVVEATAIATTTNEVTETPELNNSTTTVATTTTTASTTTESITTTTSITSTTTSEEIQTPPSLEPTQTTPDILVEYSTPAPTIAEATTDTGKIVTVSDSVSDSEGQPHTTNVLAFTNIPPIYKVGQEGKIKIKWLNNNNQDVQFHAYDLDNDGKLDYVEWTVPHLSTQTFEIIFITKALELDENNEITGDIYDQVKEQDNTWATIADGHTVRVTFEKFLTKKNDNTIFARATSNTGAGTAGSAGGTEAGGTSTQPSAPISGRIDVYPVYDDVPTTDSIATFTNIDTARIYKILLTNLPRSTNTFDLKTTGSVDIDYIVDPTPITVTDSFDNSTKIGSMTNMVVANGTISLAPATTFACGTSTFYDTRDGKSYNTVMIGIQCWMQQNMNIGIKTSLANNNSNQGTSSVSIQKYCPNDVESNCTTYGGLYQWGQAMTGSTTAGAKGICPTGWHIPTDDEFTILERTTCVSNGTAEATCIANFPYGSGGTRGTNEGTTLKNASGLFRAQLAGYKYSGWPYEQLGAVTHIWSSVGSGGYAFGRGLTSATANIGRVSVSVSNYSSVRCIKN